MAGPAPEVAILLSDAERAELERLCRAGTVEARISRRARIVLLAAGRTPNSRISEIVGLDRECVIDWRRRYAEGGVEALSDRPRSGRPPTFSPSAQAPAARAGVLAAV